MPSSSSSSKSKSCSALVLACLALFLPSCGPSTSPLIIQLRTADTHAPIPNAAVEADSLALGPSLQFGDIIDDLKGRRAAFSARAMTDEHGTARMEHIPGRAIRVTVLAPGVPGLFLLVDQDVNAAATDWLAMTASPNQASRVELQAGPSGTSGVR